MHRAMLSLIVAGALVAPAVLAADNNPDLTVYRSNNDALFSSGHGALDSGYAVVHEQRNIGYSKGAQDLTLGNLPDYLDPEAVDLHFTSDKVQVLSQRLLLAQGRNGTLLGQIGKQVSVIGANGQQLVKGQLVRVGNDGSLVIGGDVFGPTVVHRYSAVKLVGGQVGGGSRLQVRVKASASGHSDATLTYPTSGLGWRAAYTATLEPGHGCHMQLRAQASIANRSGRDWDDTDIKLIAGQPNISKHGNGGPHPVAMSYNAKAAAAPMPQQDTLDAYRSFSLPGKVDLPDNSVTLTPLYHPHKIDCERTWSYETGRVWTPSRPMTNASMNGSSAQGNIASVLKFHAFDTLPEGYLRALITDKDGRVEFLGEGQVADTPKSRAVMLTLGTAFDLKAKRERTSFNLDKSAHSMDEAFRVTLTNAGSEARTVTVTEHPDRWNQWSLTSSSIKPDKQTPDTLEFRVDVPANGKADLDYAIRYQWTAADE